MNTASHARYNNILHKSRLIDDISRCTKDDCAYCQEAREDVARIDSEAEHARNGWECWDQVPLDLRKRVLSEFHWNLASDSFNSPKGFRSGDTFCPWGQ